MSSSPRIWPALPGRHASIWARSPPNKYSTRSMANRFRASSILRSGRITPSASRRHSALRRNRRRTSRIGMRRKSTRDVSESIITVHGYSAKMEIMDSGQPLRGFRNDGLLPRIFQNVHALAPAVDEVEPALVVRADVVRLDTRRAFGLSL